MKESVQEPLFEIKPTLEDKYVALENARQRSLVISEQSYIAKLAMNDIMTSIQEDLSGQDNRPPAFS